MKYTVKRWMTFMLAAVFLLTGCSKNVEDSYVEETEETVVEEVTILEETEETADETLPLSIQIDTNHKYYYLEGEEEPYLQLQYCDVSVEGDDYIKLKRNLENWSMERSEGLRSLYTTFETSAGEQQELNELFTKCDIYQEVTIARADERVVSLLDDTYQYTGGAHGMFYREGVTFDSVTGRKLFLSDVFYDYDAFVEDAKDRIIYELRETYGEELFDDYITTVNGLWDDGNEPQWYLDASGIVIVLQEYHVGPYVMGTPQIHLPYEEFAPYIKADYFPGTAMGVASFAKNQEVFLTLPGFAGQVPMMLLSEQQETEMYHSLWLGQNELPLESFLILEDSYIVRTEDEVYCLIEVDFASDDYMTYVFRITEGVLEKVTEIDAAIDAGNISSQGMKMESWVYLLGTYGGVKNYYFDASGKLVTEDKEYNLEKNTVVLTTKADLPIILDEAESVLPSGSHITLTATDGESYVKFTIQETGQCGTLQLQRGTGESYAVYINGMNENDCFEFLPYAG